MNNDTRNEEFNDGRRSIRALRLSPLKDVEKTPSARKTVPTNNPMSFRDPNGDRPLGIERSRPKRAWTWIHTAFVAGSLVVLGVALYPILFPKATVTVTPRSSALTFSEASFDASKDGESGVRYTLSPVVLSETVSIPASQKKQVEEKARGVITIENRAQTASQRLIKNTRFESATGKIYRIRESIVIPGYTGSGDTLRAGSLDVEVFADEAGPSYNLQEGTLTIPGLKDKAELFNGIRAKVKTALRGGSTGTKFVIANSERDSAKMKLDTSLIAKAREEAAKVIPEGSLAVRGGESVVMRDLVDEESGTSVIVGREITYTQMVFDMHALAEYLRSQSSNADLPDSPARISNPEALGITLSAPEDSDESVFSAPSTEFTLAGKPTLVWEIDVDALKQSLANVTRDEIQDILKKNQTIGEGTQVDIMPFWKNTVPGTGSIDVQIAPQK
jgi:hypothetical protein